MQRFASVAVLLVAGFLSSGCGSSAAAPEGAAPGTAAPTIPVEVTRPLRGEMLATFSGTATLEAEADADIVARVGGEVRRLLVEEGDRVRPGQVLAVLDSRQLALEAAQAQAALARLEQEHRRQLELHRRGLVAAGSLDNLRYELAEQRARYELARLQLSWTEIRAPFAGIVAARRVRLGQNVAAGSAPFRITAPAPLKAAVFIPERELGRLARGQEARVAVDALPGRSFPARVMLVSPTVDAATGTFKATVEVQDPTSAIRPGMFARVGIVFERRPGALQIPRVAVLEDDGAASVFIVSGGKAVARPVRLGLSQAGMVEIAAGLEGGEQVVIVGQNGLKEGNDVRVVSLAQPARG